MFIRQMLMTILAAVAMCVECANAESPDGLSFIPADDQRLSYSDYVHLAFVDSPLRPETKMARFDRLVNTTGKGYQWDTPGVRLRFRTNARAVVAHLYYNEKHISTSARNPVGVYFIDGKTDPSWTFGTAEKKTVRSPEEVRVCLPVPAEDGAHEYEIVLPYGDAVDVHGVSLSGGALLERPAPRPSIRCAMYGDSITQGFTASSISSTYAFQFARRKDWQLVNIGIGGWASRADDGGNIASLGCDVVVALIGCNDWQGGVPVATYKANIAGFIKNLRAKQSAIPMYFITPLWVPPSWKPATAVADLEEYRKALREAVAASGDPRVTIIEGPLLIDHDPKFFDAVAVHPNDAGFAMMAERLAEAIRF